MIAFQGPVHDCILLYVAREPVVKLLEYNLFPYDDELDFGRSAEPLAGFGLRPRDFRRAVDPLLPVWLL